MNEKGPVLGVIGRKAIHQMQPDERKKGVEMENIWVDIGSATKKEAEKRVSVGDPIVIDVPFAGRSMGIKLYHVLRMTKPGHLSWLKSLKLCQKRS